LTSLERERERERERGESERVREMRTSGSRYGESPSIGSMTYNSDNNPKQGLIVEAQNTIGTRGAATKPGNQLM
jgi:hypothetical protein